MYIMFMYLHVCPQTFSIANSTRDISIVVVVAAAFRVTFICLLLFVFFPFPGIQRRAGRACYLFLVSNPFSTCHSDFPTDRNTWCRLFIIMQIYYMCAVGLFIFLFLLCSQAETKTALYCSHKKYTGCRCRPVTDKVIGGSILYRGITTRILHVYSVTICFLSKLIYHSARHNNSYIRTLLVKICWSDF